jgi:hypothetical protein
VRTAPVWRRAKQSLEVFTFMLIWGPGREEVARGRSQLVMYKAHGGLLLDGMAPGCAHRTLKPLDPTLASPCGPASTALCCGPVA